MKGADRLRELMAASRPAMVFTGAGDGTTFESDARLPVCDRCRGIVKTATISFGQAMPPEVVRRV
jgi:NAD-dependent SIR2 family protein deacetylase